ncbi:MAG: hypothetical protein LBB34_01180, partial [Holosporales bacterium]|nr:hypothetical protein [Holosporales bacterium]
KFSIAQFFRLHARQNRPRIFFAGQNDCASGNIPYDDKAKTFHSPVFASTHDALLFLDGIAAKNDWTIFYKPHPATIVNNPKVTFTLKATVVINQCDVHEIINLTDVTVTILSQTAYVALIMRKPVVMLGYTQLRYSSSTYNAFEQDDIEDTIKQAVAQGFTSEQQAHFIKHVALLSKYYLVDDLQKKDFSYRSIDKATDMLSMRNPAWLAVT